MWLSPAGVWLGQVNNARSGQQACGSLHGPNVWQFLAQSWASRAQQRVQQSLLQARHGSGLTMHYQCIATRGVVSSHSKSPPAASCTTLPWSEGISTRPQE